MSGSRYVRRLRPPPRESEAVWRAACGSEAGRRYFRDGGSITAGSGEVASAGGAAEATPTVTRGRTLAGEGRQPTLSDHTAATPSTATAGLDEKEAKGDNSAVDQYVLRSFTHTIQSKIVVNHSIHD